MTSKNGYLLGEVCCEASVINILKDVNVATSHKFIVVAVLFWCKIMLPF